MNRIYVVCPAWDGVSYKNTPTQLGMQVYKLKDADTNLDLAFFFDMESALVYAQRQAAINGGRELAVCECTTQFYSKPSEIRQKIWNGEELIPQ